MVKNLLLPTNTADFIMDDKDFMGFMLSSSIYRKKDLHKRALNQKDITLNKRTLTSSQQLNVFKEECLKNLRVIYKSSFFSSLKTLLSASI